MAHLFGREGARVSIIDRNDTAAEKAKAELRENGIEIHSFCADVADEQGVAAAFEQIVRLYDGIVHVLVNNAGIAEFGGVEDTTLACWERIMAINVTGTFLCSRAALPHMKSEGGAIVNIASIAGLVGIPKMPAYCASKAAIIGLTRQLAADYTGVGIRVNCICPGRIAGTELDRWIMELDSPEQTQAKRGRYPIGRFGRPEEIAQTALFLASDEASFVAGAILTIDGAMTVI